MNWVFTRENVSKASRSKKFVRSKRVKTDTYNKLYSLSNKQGALMNADLFHGISTFKKKIPDGALTDAVQSGDFSRVTRVIPWDDLPFSLAAAMEAVGETTEMAGLLSLKSLPPNISEHLRWDIKNPLIRTYIDTRTADLVVGIQADAQEVIQNFVARSFTETMSPREIARQIKSSIGLYPAQERALANFRNGLLKQGIVGQKLETMAGNYEQKLLNYRAMMIARTETRGATNEGQLSVWRSAAKQDLFDAKRAERVWVAEGPEPCDDCLAMDGVATGLDEPWVMPDGTAVDCPPWDVHPHCYCGMELQFNVHGTEKEIEEDNE